MTKKLICIALVLLTILGTSFAALAENLNEDGTTPNPPAQQGEGGAGNVSDTSGSNNGTTNSDAGTDGTTNSNAGTDGTTNSNAGTDGTTNNNTGTDGTASNTTNTTGTTGSTSGNTSSSSGTAGGSADQSAKSQQGDGEDVEAEGKDTLPEPPKNPVENDGSYQVTITAKNASIAIRVPVASEEGEAGEGGEEGSGAQATEAAEEIEIPKVNLKDYASAVDEAGNEVPVYVYDDGGFDAGTLGAYTVTFMAMHPLTGEEYYKECTLTVRTQEYIEAELRVADPSSNARYRKYAAYKKSIQKDLNKHIDRLNEEFAERVGMIVSAFAEVEDVEFLRVTYPDQDEAQEEGAAPAVEYVEMEDIVSTNWAQVLPVFVAKSSMKVKEPLDLYNLRKISLSKIDEVFWDMHEWSFYLQEDGTLQLILTERSSEEMAQDYEMDEKTLEKLDELMQPEFQMLFASLTGDDTFMEASTQAVEQVRETLPEGLSMQREQVVLTAHSLVGKVKYFWGGKYTQLGWNPLWGAPKIVESPNSVTFGSIRPMGLDCSGYAEWVFINAAGDTAVADAIGAGTNMQWNNSKTIAWEEALPGDLAFKAIPGRTATNHVGIVVERREDGTYLIAHCSSSQNGVILSEAKEGGFNYMRRPMLYEDVA